MGDWITMRTQLATVIEAQWPEAWANGVYGVNDLTSIRAKAEADQLPFVLWSRNLVPDPRDGDEQGPVRILYVANRNLGDVALIGKLLLLQAALYKLRWTTGGGGTIEGKPKLDPGDEMELNLAFAEAGQPLWAGQVIAQVHI